MAHGDKPGAGGRRPVAGLIHVGAYEPLRGRADSCLVQPDLDARLLRLDSWIGPSFDPQAKRIAEGAGDRLVDEEGHSEFLA
jgi:hypothetical protein